MPNPNHSLFIRYAQQGGLPLRGKKKHPPQADTKTNNANCFHFFLRGKAAIFFCPPFSLPLCGNIFSYLLKRICFCITFG
jgi:hypothetical protein